MTKRKLVFASMFLLFVLVVFAAVTTLTTPLYSVTPTTEAKEEKGGNWEFVCCGDCPSNEDYCVGTGTYTCCK